MILLNKNKIYLIGILWVFLTVWNINKPFHIDDTIYLEISQWIESNPLKPMSGLINWYGTLQPNYEFNNPRLFMYLQAIWGKIFSYDEISFHLLISLFLGWSLIRFYQLSVIFKSTNPTYLTLIFGLSPALLIGQNVMIDVPLIALWIEFFYWTFNNNVNYTKKIFFSSIVVSIAFLTKYTSILLFPVLIINILYSKRFINFLWLIIPILSISLWSLFNIYDFGNIHLLNLPSKPFWIERYLETFIGIFVYTGVIFFPVILIIFSDFKEKQGLFRRFTIFILVICLLWPALLISNFFFDIDKVFYNKLFFISSLFSGIIIIIFLLIKNLLKSKNLLFQKNNLILNYWIFSIPMFIIFFSPFLATRHLLLIFPALILFFAENIEDVLLKRKKLSIILFVVFFMNSNIFAKADYWFAKLYKNQAEIISNDLAEFETVWFNGNWGWQWYAKKNTMLHFSPADNKMKFGDVIVIPSYVFGGIKPKDVNLSLFKEYRIKRDNWYKKFSMIWFYSYFNFYSEEKNFFINDEDAEVFKVYIVKN